jgi:hypothetical protein
MPMGVADRAVSGGNIQRKDMNVHGRWRCRWDMNVHWQIGLSLGADDV